MCKSTNAIKNCWVLKGECWMREGARLGLGLGLFGEEDHVRSHVIFAAVVHLDKVWECRKLKSGNATCLFDNFFFF